MYMQQMPGEGSPVIPAGGSIYREGTEETRGRDALHLNITAGKAVAAAIRTTLGPHGMDKMLVDSIGDVVITNDGITILQEMEIEHPAAKMMIEVAKVQDSEAGDGTTTAVIIGGELLRMAEDLIDQDLHPTIIAEGYRMAQEKAKEILSEISFEVHPDDTQLLRAIAETAMTGKGAEAVKEQLSDCIVQAVGMVAREKGTCEVDDIKIEKKVGGSSEDSEIVDGIIIDKERLNPAMPECVSNAKVLLLNTAVELRQTEIDAEISITNPEQIQEFLRKEEEMEKALVDRIVASGADVVFCQKGIDEFAEKELAKAGIFALRRLKKSDMERLADATGAEIVSSFDTLSSDDLGFAGEVEEKRIAGKRMVVVSKCQNPGTVSIIVSGGSDHVVNELLRAVDDGVHVVCSAFEENMAVPGGGASEVALSRRIREYGSGVGGRPQLAIEAFAGALEVIPKTLAENAGLDPIDMLVDLRTAHGNAGRMYGIDPDLGIPVDMKEAGVVEPLRVKTQAISSATEAAVMILRIDEIIAASKSDMPGEEEMAKMGDIGGMGGMPMM